MANQRTSNTYYVDTSSASSDTTSFISQKGLTVKGILLTVSASTDVVDIYDLASSLDKAGPKKMSLKYPTADESVLLGFKDAPISCSNGLWITLTGSPVVTFVFG